jgi:3-phenylpropionate/trans-cinnamate dioxygenase ferredoxin reductase component
VSSPVTALQAGPGVVLVGGGVAAVSAVRSLRTAGYLGSVTLLSEETESPYDRPPLSKQYLAGTLDTAAVALLRDGEAEALDLCVRPDTTVHGLDTTARTVLLADGGVVPYAALVVATGASVRRLPLDHEPAGVHHLRTRADADALRASLATGKRLVVVGAGFIGLEVAATARAAGADVVVLESAPGPLTRVLGPEAGRAVAQLHERRGVELRFGVTVCGVRGDERVESVEVEVDGVHESVPADTVVVGIGAVPRTEWLAGSEVQVDDGVVCDASGRSSVTGVYAAGDVARWRNTLTGTHARVEQWQSATEQGAIVGATVAADVGVDGATEQRWSSVPYFWSDQYEQKVQFCGATGAVHEARQTRRGWVTVYGDRLGGRLVGVLAIDGPVALARGRKQVAAGVAYDDALTWLASL